LSARRENGQKEPRVVLIGYARVSTVAPTLAFQLDALRAAGCEQVFVDRASGAKADRPGLGEAVGYVRRGKTLVTWKLERLGRSMAHLIEIVRLLNARDSGSGR
jgi:DNA invertase Pin-like site-specific DNA recombinase